MDTFRVLAQRAGRARRAIQQSLQNPHTVALLAAAVVFVLLLFSWQQTSSWYILQLRREQQANAAVAASTRANALATTINRRLAQWQGVNTWLQSNQHRPEFSDAFTSYADNLYGRVPEVRLVALAPGGTIQHVYPLAGNEALLGFDPLTSGDNELMTDARNAIETGQLILSGPVRLWRDEPDVIGWQAVHQNGRYWGLAMIVLDVPVLLTDAGVNPLPGAFLQYGLRDDHGRIFTGDPALFDEDPLAVDVGLGSERWALAVLPSANWAAAIQGPQRLFQASGLLIILLMTALTYQAVNRQASLKQAVAQRTQELAELNADLEARVTRRTHELTTLLEVSQRVGSTLDPATLLGLVLDQLKSVVPYTGATILTREENAFVVREERGPVPEKLAADFHFPLDNEINRQIVNLQQAVIIDDIWGETSLAHAFRETNRDWLENVRPHLRSWMGIPLVAREQVIGMLVCNHHAPGYYNADRVRLALAFASKAAVAIDNARLFNTVQRRAEQFRLIGETGRRITSIMELDELLEQVVQRIQQSFDYYHVGLGLVDGDEIVYKVGAGSLWDNPEFDFQPARLKIGGEGLTGWVAGHRQLRLAPDVSQEPQYIHMAHSQTRSELVLPLMAQGELIGVLDVQSERLNAFDETDLTVLQSLADQTGVAIQNARLFAAEQRRAEQFRAIVEVGHHIISILDVDELLSQTARLIQQTFGYYHVHIGLVDVNELVFNAAAGVWREEESCTHCPGLRLRVGTDGISGRVAGTGEPILVPDVRQDPRYLAFWPVAPGSELVLPLKVKEQVIGVLDVESDRLNGFDDSDIVVLQSLANQIAIAIDNARLYEQAGELAALQERQRLARELHDSVSQALYGIALGTRSAQTLLERVEAGRAPADTLARPLEYTISLAEAGLAEMRALIFELRPESLEAEGLVAALDKQAAAARARYSLSVTTRFENEPEIPLRVKEAFYRVAQEALHNIVKHARAGRVEIGLWVEDTSLHLEIRDDGRGFDTENSFPGHLGLHSMRERLEEIGAQFQLESSPGEGTCIRATYPLPFKKTLNV